MSYTVPGVPRGVRNLLIATLAVYIVQLLPLAGPWVLENGALIPSAVFGGGQVWRLVTYLFLHDPSGPWHLLFNMLALWMFGTEIEQAWGGRRFVIFYFVSGVGAGLLSFVMWNTPIIGASGAVLALLTVYAWYFPKRQVLMFFVIPMPVWAAVALIGLISLVGSIGSVGGIAHLTHLGGIFVALVYLKGYPLFERWADGRRERREPRTVCLKAVQPVAKESRFSDVIDPILEKISKQGMSALTPADKETLQRASKRQREDEARGKILPFK
jgi:membrane associated rhomboid family serine protease